MNQDKEQDKGPAGELSDQELDTVVGGVSRAVGATVSQENAWKRPTTMGKEHEIKLQDLQDINSTPS